MSSIRDARPDEVELVRSLFREYAASLDRDLSFQEFERELTELPDYYRVILFAEVEGEVAGCAAVREFAPGVAELKRLYVRPAARGAVSVAHSASRRSSGPAPPASLRSGSTRCRR